MSAQVQLPSDIEGLARQVDPLSRRGFFMSSAAAGGPGPIKKTRRRKTGDETDAPLSPTASSPPCFPRDAGGPPRRLEPRSRRVFLMRPRGGPAADSMKNPRRD